GGLAQQGYPLSDEFTEISPQDGKPYTVQYFERAVFEYHPENKDTPYEVLLSQLGTSAAQQLTAGSRLTCEAGLLPIFQPAWAAHPELARTLGCPGAWSDLQTAIQPFEHGTMLFTAPTLGYYDNPVGAI